MITGEMSVAQLLDEHPELVDRLADYHPHFKLLRSRLLRKVMAPRVTVTQAARIAGVPLADLLTVLRRAVGEQCDAGRSVIETIATGASAPPRPAALIDVPETHQRHLDVRDDIRRGEEPFARIMAAVKALGADEVLVLRAPFEPVPLYGVLGKRGFAHWPECRGPADWSVWFYREGEPRAQGRAPVAAGSQLASTPGPAIVQIDVRGLEPPQPMLRVLEQLDRLHAEQQLEVIHDRRPVFLYPQLDERGFSHETHEPEPGVVRIVIWRGSTVC